MHSDSFFCIGSSHNVCQDYALAGVSSRGQTYAVVSDGCSGSPHTDFGSRLLTKAVHHALDTSTTKVFQDEGVVLSLDFMMVALLADQMASSCHMDHDCLDATLLCAVEAERGGRPGVQVVAAGDGVIVARHRNQTFFDTHNIEFPSGYPAYANYQTDYPRMIRYMQATAGGLGNISISKGDDKSTQTLEYPFYHEEGNCFRPYSVFFDQEKYDLVLLLSDGALSFQAEEVSLTSKKMTAVKLEAVLQGLTDFKNMKGEFVVRRAKRFLGKTCAENRWTHFDDLSIAAIAMD